MILCDKTTFTRQYFTNDINSVTCNKCKLLYQQEELRKLKDTKDNKSMREIFNKKNYTNDELDRVLNQYETGYGEEI